ncbi:Fur family transcriptional regulator [Novosphingobium album (ex Liu et al. 2023)]|uniref:Ferric uptake regulation protein n=1 Tax=Novosphingobium album (ex Liu et al. 2023) TaxID=3031130 RepID=A0ABT5WJY5_9SPHN|nr:hypothetical protein [Novosphingobium album (ex Liu et al. 2023)]MDE8650341.1 hypothetical protein [Novosphingobium album (ex Liu et al. 2023)]
MARRTNRKTQDCEAIILAALAGEDRPLTAYDVQSRAAQAGARLFPAQIYRAMERLIATGQVHRIETSKAYMLRGAGIDAIAVCEACGRVQPHALGAPVSQVARAIGDNGFTVRALVIEAVGRCADCPG